MPHPWHEISPQIDLPREFFAVGASRFGIADLETFRQQAPKFQAYELDRLVGPYPRRWPPTGPGHRCMLSTGLPGRCCCCMGWRTPWCRRAKPRSWPRRLSVGVFGTSCLPFPVRGMGFAVPRASGVRSRLSCLSMLKRWGWRPVSPVPRPPPMARSRPARPISGQTGRSLIRRSSRTKGHLHPCLSGVHPTGSDGGVDCSPWLLLLRQLGPLRPRR